MRGYNTSGIFYFMDTNQGEEYTTLLFISEKNYYLHSIMENLNIILSYTLLGIGLVTIIDISGSIISRRLNFNYGYFTILSFVVYTYIPYLVMKEINLAFSTFLCSLLIGYYDGYFGWKISQQFKANYGPHKEEIKRLTTAHTILAAILFAIVCGGIGIFMGKS